MDIAFIKNTLGSSSKLIRDNAVETLCEFIRISKFDDPKAREFELLIVDVLASGHDNQELGWESYNGCLLALDCFVACDSSLYAKENPQNLIVKSRCLRFCHHEESRLKTTLGEFLHTMTFKHGASVYKFCANELLPTIVDLVDAKAQSLDDNIISPAKVKNFASLESYVKILSLVFNGCVMWFDHELKPIRADMPQITPRDNINAFIQSQDLINLHKLTLTLSHSNDSYVREMSVNILNDILLLHNVQAEIYTGSTSLLFNADESAKMIANGLSDEANHVCLAACSAFTELWKFLKFKSLGTDAYSAMFLPRLCLLRYCVAEGVRLKAADAWLIFADSNGQTLLEKNLALVANYYAEKFRSENYMTRQCCCHASAEFIRKLSKESVRPLVVEIFGNLIHQLDDRSWEVRDSANLVCGEYINEFPVECLPLLKAPGQKNALEFLFNNLANDSYLVRSSAAQTLAKILDICSLNSVAVDADLKSNIHSTIVNGAKNGLDMTNVEVNKVDSPSNNSTPRVKWQMADGCIQLLAEMTSYQKLAAQVFQLIPNLVSALYHRNYKEHVVLLDTMIRRLPDMIKNIGKQRFKAVLDDFIEPLFYALDCGYPQITKKASDCMLTLSQLLGPSIWKAKIVKCNREYGPRYDILMELLATDPRPSLNDKQE